MEKVEYFDYLKVAKEIKVPDYLKGDRKGGKKGIPK